MRDTRRRDLRRFAEATGRVTKVRLRPPSDGPASPKGEPSLLRRCLAAAFVCLFLSASAGAADLLAEARLQYNQGQYEAAIALAAKARAAGQQVDSANLVLARAHLERFRQRVDQVHLEEARGALNEIRVVALSPRERVEFLIGLAESLYLEDAYGPAAEMFGVVMARAGDAGPAARERVLDWWASALERQAQVGPADERAAVYHRILDRMEDELAWDPSSTSASYWLVAAARGIGDLDRAWSAAIAGWIRARTLAQQTAFRADLDRLVAQAIVPERARRLAPSEPKRAQVTEELRAEWERIKGRWK